LENSAEINFQSELIEYREEIVISTKNVEKTGCFSTKINEN